MFKTQITLQYDPNLGKELIDYEPFWLIGTGDAGIGMYYQHLLKIEMQRQCRYLVIDKPAWNTHVSVVRGEEPTIAGIWGKHARRKIKIDYEPIIKTNYLHYWLDAYSSDLEDIREEMGLSRKSFVYIDGVKKPIEFHITIGNRNLELPSYLTVDEMEKMQSEFEQQLDSGTEIDPENIHILKVKIWRLKERLNRMAKSRN